MRFARSERTASRVIDGRAVVVDINSNHLFTLNEQGTVVWETLEGPPRTVDEVTGRLAKCFDAPVVRIRSDCERFLDHMIRKGLVVAVG